MTSPKLPLPSRRVTQHPRGTFAALALLALLSGCAGGPPRHHPHPAELRQPLLEARSSYFSNTVLAHAQVGSFGRPSLRPGEAPDREPGSGGRPHSGGERHGMGPVGGGGLGGGGGGPGGHREASADESRAAQRNLGAEPRQTLRISFTNTGPEPVEFAITELRSAIGNFAPQPDHLALAPGASASLDPVSGDAGGALEWLDVTLSLRRAGATETQVLHVTRVTTTEAPLPPPPS